MNTDMQKRFRAVIFGCCIAISGFTPVQAAISGVSVADNITSLKSTVVVSGSEIKADILIKSECNSAMREELANIQIGHIPHPLGELVIFRQDIIKKLGKFASCVEVPEKITIRRLGAILKGSEIGERIKSICNSSDDENLNIDLSRVPTNVVLPGNVLDWEINTSSENSLGMRLFVLSAQTDSGPFRQLFQVKITRVIEAAQLVRLAKPGEQISQDMIQPKRIEVKSDLTQVPLAYADAVGKCLGRFKSAGTVLRSNDIAAADSKICKNLPEKNIKQTANKAATNKIVNSSSRENWLIKPGENVDFRFSSGTLTMQIPAKAVQGGQIGDEITLINLQNQRRIRGIITEKGKVEYAQK